MRHNKNFIGIACTGILASLFAFPLIAFGAEPYAPLTNIPGIQGAGSDPGTFFNSVFRVGVIVAAFLAVIMIVIGAIQYMGSDTIGSKSDGRDRMTQAVVGLILILLSITILSIINPNITGLTVFQSPSTNTDGGDGSDGTDTGGDGDQEIAPAGYSFYLLVSTRSTGTPEENFFQNKSACVNQKLLYQPADDFNFPVDCELKKTGFCYKDPMGSNELAGFYPTMNACSAYTTQTNIQRQSARAAIQTEEGKKAFEQHLADRKKEAGEIDAFMQKHQLVTGEPLSCRQANVSPPSWEFRNKEGRAIRGYTNQQACNAARMEVEGSSACTQEQEFMLLIPVLGSTDFSSPTRPYFSIGNAPTPEKIYSEADANACTNDLNKFNEVLPAITSAIENLQEVLRPFVAIPDCSQCLLPNQ